MSDTEAASVPVNLGKLRLALTELRSEVARCHRAANAIADGLAGPVERAAQPEAESLSAVALLNEALGCVQSLREKLEEIATFV